MKRPFKILVTLGLILIFSTPIFIQGIHDAFFHDYSHEIDHSQSSGINTPDDNICFIHGFKYYQYDLIIVKPLDFNLATGYFKYTRPVNKIQKRKYHDFFLLRAPPYSFV
ncbi:MAG TPA: hypothetical protein ENK91_09120 [Bacteroidetes bacterium]|nr:hypothetical protein [Bacteroidota bacterium]